MELNPANPTSDYGPGYVFVVCAIYVYSFTFLYVMTCSSLGGISIFQVREANLLGDQTRAQRASRIACILNVVSVIVLFVIIVIAVLVVLLSA